MKITLTENELKRYIREAVSEAMKEAKKSKKNMKIGTIEDQIKANRKGSREAEFETKGPGFHSNGGFHKNMKKYDRKQNKKINCED